ncbi:MAG: HAD family hydrolase, partial [Nitrosarchaeum sp.]|nr:HAD family hydrolase [Nitrosarchaeum sp.]
MQKKYKKTIIFDMDGTLYQFKDGGIKGSGIYTVVVENTILYISKQLNKTSPEAQAMFDLILKKYGNSFSIGLEKEFKIERYGYFNFTWNIDPANYIKFDQNTQSLLLNTKNNFNMVLLSDAPRMWVNKVLKQLGVEEIFEGRIFTGEGNVRKEFGNAFENVVETLHLDPKECISIGDQESTDIILSKKIGMKTVHICKNKSDFAD